MSAKTLVPGRDLLFIANSKVQIADVKKTNHLHKRGGKEIFDEKDKKTFSSLGLHVFGNKKKIEETLDSMAESILIEDWIKFDTNYHEIKRLKICFKRLFIFGMEQMKVTVSRNPTIFEILTLRRKLGEIGISEKIQDKGCEEGYKILKSLNLKRKYA